MLFRKELLSHIKGIVILLLITFILMAVEINEFQALDTDGYNDLIDSMPKIIKAIIGINDYDTYDISGVFAMLMLYISIPFIVYAFSLGAKVTNKFPINKTDFIYTASYSRKQIFIKKVLALVINLVVLLLLSFILNIIILAINDETNFLYVFLIYINLFVTVILFFFIGIFVSSLSKSNYIPTIVITTIIICLYLVYVFTGILDEMNNLNYINPLSVIASKRLISDNYFNYIYFIITILLSVYLSFQSYFIFKKKDL